MQYLSIFTKFKKYIFESLLLTFSLSILISFLLASNLNSKISRLLKELEIIDDGKIPEINDLHVKELNLLQKGIVELAKNIEDRKNQLKDVYESKYEDLRLMGGAIAHEIRNPLSAIEMHFGLIRRNFKKAGIDEPESVAEVAEQLKNLKELIQKFLSYSRRIEPEIEKIKFKSAIEEIAKNQKAACEFSFLVDTPENESIYMDQAMFKQIFENLFKNSMEAKNGSLEIKVSAKTKDAWSIIRFQDNGTGINEKIKNQLFMPFVTGKKNGNGIGLALTRKFVEAHQGKIYLDSSTSNATVFVIEVPKNENPDS
jgi:signal transduction histidine kinase